MQGTIARQAAGLGLIMVTSLVMAQQPGTAESPGAIQQQQQQEIERRLRDERIQQRPVAPEISLPQGGPATPASTAKSIRFGASMVMIGSLFAGHEESPGKTVEVDGELFKEYYGSASDFNKGEYKHVEGKRILEPIKGRLSETLIEMEQDVQSSISYSGGRKLMDVRKVNYVILGGDNAGEHLLM